MWISSRVDSLLRDKQSTIMALVQFRAEAEAKASRVEVENARLRADLDWFKLRLNAVEKERAQLIAAAIGVKISIPEFQPRMDNPEEALNQLPDLSTIGNDAVDTNIDPAANLGQEQAVSYELMPGYRRNE